MPKPKQQPRIFPRRTDITPLERAVWRLCCLGWTTDETATYIRRTESAVAQCRRRLAIRFNCEVRQLPFMGFVVGVVDQDAHKMLGYVRAISGPPTFVLPGHPSLPRDEDETSPPTPASEIPAPLKAKAAKRMRYFAARIRRTQTEIDNAGLRITGDTTNTGDRFPGDEKHVHQAKGEKVVGDESENAGNV
jgi:hypothetical protein